MTPTTAGLTSPHSRALFVQIALAIEESILRGELAEGDLAPSTNSLASTLGVNPATAQRGAGLLVARGVLEKRRGIGMMVASGARERILTRRRAELLDNHIRPLLHEVHLLGLAAGELNGLIETASHERRDQRAEPVAERR